MADEIEVSMLQGCELTTDRKKKEVTLTFPTNQGKGELLFWVSKPGLYSYQIVRDREVVKTFMDTKPLYEMGKTKACQIYQNLQDAINEYSIIPYPDSNDGFDKRVKTLLSNLYVASREVDKRTVNQWTSVKIKEEVPSWFEIIGEYDDFSDEILLEAKEILLNKNVVEEIYKVLELKVVAQKPKVVLSLLIALSAVFDKALHSLLTGHPGKSKTSINKPVFDIFPKQRRIRFSKSSTLAGLMNMTNFKEGMKILARKLIRVGDFGSTKEQAQAEEIISLLKEMMSEGEYDKILTDMQDDSGRAKVLQLRGCGSVQMEIISQTIEAQYLSRSLQFSPDDNKYVQDAIRDYQEDEIDLINKSYLFNERRLLMAAVIEEIFRFSDGFFDGEHGFEVLNPYTTHFNSLLNVSNSPNANRDRMMMQAIPKMITITNCLIRPLFYHPVHDVYALVVDKDDYLYMVKTLGKTLSHFIHKKPEVLLSYLNVIETYFAEKSAKHLMKHYRDTFGINMELEGKNTTNLMKFNTIKKCAEKNASKDGNAEGMEEDLAMYKEMYHFGYEEVAKHTTVTVDTVRDHIKELEDLGIIYIDKELRPHRIYIPSDYSELKDKAFKDIFDYDKARSEESDTNPLRLEESHIYNIYEQYLRRMEHEGWSRTDAPTISCKPDETEDTEGVEKSLLESAK